MNTKSEKLIVKEKLKNLLFSISNPVLAIIIAFIMGGLIVLLSGESPVAAYTTILNGAFGSAKGIGNTIRYAIPMVLLAYSFSICDRCGYFNIGHEAQIYGAAIAVGAVSQAVNTLPVWLQMILMILAGCAAAVIVCVIPALVKYKLGASEIVVGVMLNYMMALLLNHLLKFSFIGDQSKSTLMSKGIEGDISQGALLVIVLCVVAFYYFILKRSVVGYRLQVVGRNPLFANASGLPSTKVIFTSAIVGGVLSGVVACGEIFGNYDVIYSGFAADFGFNGMTAALIGSGHPVGMVFGSLLFGALRSGSGTLDVATNVPVEIVDCVQGFVLLFASVSIIRRALNRKGKLVKTGEERG